MDFDRFDDMEDKRLIRMGIDPDGDPVKIMQEVEQRYNELQARDKRRDDAGTESSEEPNEPGAQ